MAFKNLVYNISNSFKKLSILVCIIILERELCKSHNAIFNCVGYTYIQIHICTYMYTYLSLYQILNHLIDNIPFFLPSF